MYSLACTCFIVLIHFYVKKSKLPFVVSQLPILRLIPFLEFAYLPISLSLLIASIFCGHGLRHSAYLHQMRLPSVDGLGWPSLRSHHHYPFYQLLCASIHFGAQITIIITIWQTKGGCSGTVLWIILPLNIHFFAIVYS